MLFRHFNNLHLHGKIKQYASSKHNGTEEKKWDTLICYSRVVLRVTWVGKVFDSFVIHVEHNTNFSYFPPSLTSG